MLCRHPCRLYIHLAFTYSLGPSSTVWSELRPSPPFPPMRVLEAYWSRALSPVCEVALSIITENISTKQFVSVGVWAGRRSMMLLENWECWPLKSCGFYCTALWLGYLILTVNNQKTHGVSLMSTGVVVRIYIYPPLLHDFFDLLWL